MIQIRSKREKSSNGSFKSMSRIQIHHNAKIPPLNDLERWGVTGKRARDAILRRKASILSHMAEEDEEAYY